jgi:hypothetical protein
MTYLAAITIVHTVLSLIAIVAGVPVVRDLLAGRRGADQAFLATAALTSLTGFVFPFKGVTPGQIVGGLALAILAVCWARRGRLRDSGLWRAIYASGMTASLYLLVFVGVVQAFKHLGPLNALAPNGNEPPFVAVQAVLLVVFVVIGFLAARRFRRAGETPAASPLGVR